MSKNNYVERMHKVVAYIEENLNSEIDADRLAGIACYSRYHFHRLFRAFVGESIYAYRKRLLLERAVRRLQYSDDSITEIALDCGYETPSAFNKAFKQQFGLTPSIVRQRKAVLSSIIEPLLVNGKITMFIEIVTLDPINVIYAREAGDYAEAAAKAWPRIMKFAYSNRLMSSAVRIIGISHDDPTVTEAERIRYNACLDIDSDLASEYGLGRQTIAGGRYAKFMHLGAYENFPQTFAYIFNDWLPGSQCELRDAPCFEIYLNRDPRRTLPKNLKTEIYVPIV